LLQANWHLDALDLPDDPGDPLSRVDRIIDLSKPVAELESELRRHLKREGSIALKYDVDCHLKWGDNHVLMGGSELSCFTCPHFTDDGEEIRSAICWRGRMEEEILGQMDGAVARPALEEALAAAYGRQVDEFEALAAAARA
jgi:hypothetical protein